MWPITEIDLKNPKTNRKNAGFTDEERQKFTELLEAGFIDTFRYFYPDQEGVYSWWSYRFRAREKNAGWRIDYFCVSEGLKDQLGRCENTDRRYGIGSLSGHAGNGMQNMRSLAFYADMSEFGNTGYRSRVAEVR